MSNRKVAPHVAKFLEPVQVKEEVKVENGQKEKVQYIEPENVQGNEREVDVDSLRDRLQQLDRTFRQ